MGMRRKAENHIHRYKRANLGRNGKEFLVFKCIKPICSHYIEVSLAEGKLCECNRCGEPMIMNKAAMQLAKPHCTNCIKRKPTSEATIESIQEFLSKVGNQ